MLLIGGKNEKDFIRRSLGAIFTDNLASMCSWTGQKNNFKVGDTHIIMGIKSKSFYDMHMYNTYNTHARTRTHACLIILYFFKLLIKKTIKKSHK